MDINTARSMARDLLSPFLGNLCKPLFENEESHSMLGSMESVFTLELGKSLAESPSCDGMVENIATNLLALQERKSHS